MLDFLVMAEEVDFFESDPLLLDEVFKGPWDD